MIDNIKSLDFTENSLTDLDLFEFPETLECLYLKNKNLENLPENFFEKLPNLKWLDLRNNNLETIPTKGLDSHAKLETILLEGNRIKELPFELGLVKNLKGLQLSGNPIENVPIEIRHQGTKRVLKFLRKLSKNDEKDVLQPIFNTYVKRKITINRRTTSLSIAKLAVAHNKINKYQFNNNNNNVLVTNDQIMEEERLALERAKRIEILIKQREKIQRMIDKEVLKDWRQKPRSTKIQSLVDNSQSYLKFPYGTDPNLLKILKRKDLFCSLQDYEKELKTNPVKRRKKEDLEAQINEIAEKLDKLNIEENLNNSDGKSQLLSRIQEIEQLRSALKLLEKKNMVNV